MCRRYGLGLMTYSPLAVGLLSGRFRRGVSPPPDTYWDQQRLAAALNEREDRVIETLVELAAERGATPAQLALAWLLDHSEITAPIVGADRPEYVDDVTQLKDKFLQRSLRAGSHCTLADVTPKTSIELPVDPKSGAPYKAMALRVAPDDHEVARLYELFAQLHDQLHVSSQLRHRAAAWIRSDHTLEHAARLYVAAIAMAVARRQAVDGEWMDGVSDAITDSGASDPGSELFDRWSDLRRRATAAR